MPDSIQLGTPHVAIPRFMSMIAERAPIVPIGLNDTNILINGMPKRGDVFMKI